MKTSRWNVGASAQNLRLRKNQAFDGQTLVKGEFAKKGAFSVVDEKADYWFVLSGAGQYIQSKPQKKVSVVKNENSSGGTETFAEETRNLASAAKGISVAVYEAKTLAPVHYFVS